MTFWASISVIFLGILPLIAQTAEKNICSDEFLKNETNIRKIYLNYKLRGRHCLSWKAYLQLGKRAYVAGRLKEGLWSVNRGLKSLSIKQVSFITRFKTLKGSILLEMNRFEEAIIILREAIFGDHVVESKKVLEGKEKAHLQLIKAYQKKTGSKNSQDVVYLITLFDKRYPKSKYLKLLKNWKKVR